MICCLNPDCQNPMNPDGNQCCQNCQTPLIPLLRGRYRIVKRLSVEGGFSITYLAEDIDKLNEQCVVKQLAPKVQNQSTLKKAVKLFKEEAQRLQELGEHPQIPNLLAYFEQDGYLYLVQQFIKGNNLLQRMQENGRFREPEIRKLLLDLLPVLKFIHEKGVIHRDIKPQNVIIRENDGKHVLIDFGASKLLTTTVKNKGTSIGSHGYTPVEQMQDGKAYPASDLFSLGASCFFLLTGVSPSKQWMEKGYAWITTWRKHFNGSNGQGIPISMELGEVIDKLLKVDIKERYQSADRVLKDLVPQQVSASVATTLLSSVPRNSNEATVQVQKKLKKRWLVNGGLILLTLGGGVFWFFNPPQIPLIPPGLFVNNSSVFTLVGHASDVNAVNFSPQGDKLASGSDDKTIKVWDVANREIIRTIEGHSGWIWDVAFSPDGKILASSGNDKTIKLWDLSTGKEIRTLKGHLQGVISVAFSKDGTTLASSSVDSTIKLWNVATGEEIRTLKGHSAAVNSVDFSPDGFTLASGSWDKSIKLWNVETGEKIRTFKAHKDKVFSVAFAPDGKTLASASRDKTVKVWNLAAGKVSNTLQGHTDKVNSVAYIPGKTDSQSEEDQILVSGSNDNTIKLWDVKTGKLINTLKKDVGYIYSVATSKDGKKIAGGGSAENIVKIWQL
ncbi:serine/threonine-protein kinase [Mastigocoleus testarum]|uniref:Serine/threonine protein kinase n=1 Tax=Mastigocoleus testarum BC008 TaxID=371196 RepID=A0A0V7ZKA1_9CYAN|nr:serine/threonine-protein kinase [Mastigocoleus testarum]KST64926.1 serine/threonine protein kinase [Mastigocoleus testarum BC008]KST65025.1 serine/threonine protein kinase [Mastigocoleus testarum BC008]